MLEEYGRELVRRSTSILHHVRPGRPRRDGQQRVRRVIAGGKVDGAGGMLESHGRRAGAGGEDDLAKITASTRVMTVIMPNDNSVGKDWGQYRTSPAEVEKHTRLHFFDRLPADVAATLKQKGGHRCDIPTRARRTRRRGGLKVIHGRRCHAPATRRSRQRAPVSQRVGRAARRVLLAGGRLPIGAGTLVVAHAGAGKAIQEVSADSFFTELRDADNAEGFVRLRQSLEQQLDELTVFRVGPSASTST